MRVVGIIEEVWQVPRGVEWFLKEDSIKIRSIYMALE